MRVLVLGAGVVGVTSAWYLSRAGHQVTVIEREPAPALATSFANGGQISVSHAEPWANPQAPANVLRWLLREDAPLKFRLRPDPAQWAWGARFLLECLPGRTRRNTLWILALARHSRDCLRALRAETGIAYEQQERGILRVYTDPADFRTAQGHARVVESEGIELRMLAPDQVLELEPALAESRVPIVGGVFAAGDESGDAHLFTSRLAALCEARGVEFLYRRTVQALEPEAARVKSVQVESADGSRQAIDADAYVACLGSESARVLRPLGEHLPVYPVKGYSVTIPVTPGATAPTVSLTDEARKLVFSRLGERLRVAGTAELAGYDLSLNMARCDAILERALQFFPRAGDREQAEFWAGLRPATPGNVPLIGRTRYTNLYLNTGHGTLGWTLACGSAECTAQIVAGTRPRPAFPFRNPPI